MIRILKRINKGVLTQQDAIDKGVWVDVVAPGDSEIIDLLLKLKVPRYFLTSALDMNERPRYTEHGDAKLFIFRVPTIEKNTITTVPLSIIITPDIIVTVHLKALEILDYFYNNEIEDFSTNKHIHTMLQILIEGSKYLLKLLDKVELQIEGAEKNLPKSLRNREILRLLDIQKTLTYFNTAVVSNQAVINFILKCNLLKFTADEESMMKDITIENKQCIDTISIYNRILQNMINASASIISNNLSAIMKVLASITIIISIPTIITSFYGMNVELPFQSHPLAFIIAILMAVMLVVVMVFMFYKKRWL